MKHSYNTIYISKLYVYWFFNILIDLSWFLFYIIANNIMTRILHDDHYNDAIKLIKKYIYIQSKSVLFVFLILVIERVSISLQPVSD